MEAHDLVLAKCAAGRERDWEFAEQAIAHEIVDPDELLKREPDLPLSPEHHEHLRLMLAGTIKRATKSADTK